MQIIRFYTKNLFEFCIILNLKKFKIYNVSTRIFGPPDYRSIALRAIDLYIFAYVICAQNKYNK